MKIRCEYKKLVPLAELKEHPKNRNSHSEAQIARLAQIIEYQGFRHPIIVSNLSGFICAGHGRLAAARKLGLAEVPVDYQDFGSEEEEYAFLVSDNSIQLWSELDLAGINSDLPDLGPDFNIDMLGVKNFFLDPSEGVDPSQEWQGMPEFNQQDKNSFRHVVVHFMCEDHVKKFFESIGQRDTGETRSIWFPMQENMDTESKRYGNQL